MFLAEIQGLECYLTDIGNAFLEYTSTKEKVAIIAGEEFGDLKGHLLIFYKSCYGLKTSVARFTELLRKFLEEELGFKKAKVEDEIYMRKSADGTHWEYLCTYMIYYLQLTIQIFS